MSQRKPVFERFILKLSGEILGGKSRSGIDTEVLKLIVNEIVTTRQIFPTLQLGIVVGGGNFFRGASIARENGLIGRMTADYMGMLGTTINALALKDVLDKYGLFAKIMTAREIEGVGEPFSSQKAIDYMHNGRVVIFSGGTGSPFFSTDTAAVLRAIEVGAEAVFKGTKVDGVFDRDPEKYCRARKLSELTKEEALRKNIKVMDATSFTLSMGENIKIIVFNILKKGNLKKIVSGEKIGTIVY